MAARLKVFVTSDGLSDYVVAASSRPKALAAWGAHQDMFKTGGARETTDAELVRAAVAEPGKVLRRPANTNGLLAALPKLKPAKRSGPSKVALRKVADLEQKLAALDRRRDDALEDIAAARAALDLRETEQMTRLDADEDRLKAALRLARSGLD